MRIIAIHLIALLLTSFNSKDEVEYKQWLQFHHLKSADFVKVGNDIERKMMWEGYDLSPEIIELYQQFFISAPNKSHFVDMDTYSLILEEEKGELCSTGFGVDTEVKLIRSSNNQYARILFCGTACIPETGYWISNSVVEILGFEFDGDGKAIPTRWRYDIPNSISSKYQIKECKLDLVEDYVINVRLSKINFKV